MTGFALLWSVAAVLGTACLVLYAAETARPREDQTGAPKPLNLMLTSVFGWLSLLMVGVMGIYRLGLVRPALVAIVLYGIYRLALTKDLQAYYPFNVPIGVLALIGAILVIATATPQRITP